MKLASARFATIVWLVSIPLQLGDNSFYTYLRSTPVATKVNLKVENRTGKIVSLIDNGDAISGKKQLCGRGGKRIFSLKDYLCYTFYSCYKMYCEDV